jgi:hypothetical protein
MFYLWMKFSFKMIKNVVIYALTNLQSQFSRILNKPSKNNMPFGWSMEYD